MEQIFIFKKLSDYYDLLNVNAKDMLPWTYFLIQILVVTCSKSAM